MLPQETRNQAGGWGGRGVGRGGVGRGVWGEGGASFQRSREEPRRISTLEVGELKVGRKH